MEYNYLLKLQNISKVYRRSHLVVEALKEVSFNFYQGEILALLGVNGAGKTTLSSILATLHPPSSGTILWREKSIYTQLLAYRKMMGFCPQMAHFEQGLSLSEHLTFAAQCYGFSKKKALYRKDAMVERFELRSYSHAEISQLSGGYKQRFMIAKSLIHEPKFLILDEPTVGLDSHIRRQLWNIIADLKSSSISVLLTTHYLDEAEALSDRVCLIHGGKIHHIGPPSDLKKYHKKNSLEEVFLAFVADPNIMKRMEE